MNWVNILNDSNFKDEISSWIYVVDFWAEWCGPCQVMLPILGDFAAQVSEWVKVWKVNVDEAPAIAQAFRVMSIPTIIIFKDWKMQGAPMVWVQSIENLNKRISELL